MHQDHGDCDKNDHECNYGDETCRVCFDVDDTHILHVLMVLHSHDGRLGLRNTRIIPHENVRKHNRSLHTIRVPDCSSRASGDVAFASPEKNIFTIIINKQLLSLPSFSNMANVVDSANIHQPRVRGDGRH